ncbi:hypothetical protein [Terrarubrum flagellatum]|uniref:hypothetical protein n=1 Tax=Terrirubrum flagellatum TaxID=2895980 RepID=UPI003145159F
MLTAHVVANDDAIALAETLAALVPAAIDGLVRRVVVITRGEPDEDVAALIDASGAAHVVASDDPMEMWGRPAEDHAGEWSLYLLAGLTPVSDWADMVARHVSRPKAGPAVFALAGGWRVRAATLARRISGRRDPAWGLLARGDAGKGSGVTRLAATLEDRRDRS